jgi:DNA polymerase lambda
LGPRGAEKLYQQGIKSIEDLRKHEDKLTSMQKIGLKYYEDFKERMPRAEVEQLLARVRKGCYEEVKGGDKVLSVEACGSFRRGSPTCGDIDVLITMRDGSSIKGLCERIVKHLECQGFLKERLGDFRYSTTGSEGYMGVC